MLVLATIHAESLYELDTGLAASSPRRPSFKNGYESLLEQKGAASPSTSLIAAGDRCDGTGGNLMCGLGSESSWREP